MGSSPNPPPLARRSHRRTRRGSPPPRPHRGDQGPGCGDPV